MEKDYDVIGAFQAIEEELIDSMLRNYKKHRAWERDEGFDWEMWQAKQLKSLQAYRNRNKKHFKSYFSTINEKIEEMLIKSYTAGSMDQEAKILEAIKRGYKPPRRRSEYTDITGEFFKVNDRKLKALIKSTKEDMKKAETAVLRKANDEYRKTIFNAQVYANTGSGTYEKAVDMATKDFLSKGINCIEYKNGARVNIVDYVSMAIQTASKRAYLQGEGSKRQEWGISTVIVASRGGGCPLCVPFQGRIFIDDVWSGGNSKDGSYPLLSGAISAGLYHPRCKDTHTTYFEGITSEPTPPTKSERSKMLELYTLGQKVKYAERMTRKYDNLQKGSLDSDNRAKYKNRKLQWQKIKNTIDELTRNNPPINFKNINSKYKEELLNVIKNAPKVIRDVTLDNIEHILFAKINVYGVNRYNKKYGIFINLKKDSTNIKGKWASVFHETGHNIDNVLGNISYRDGRFKRALINDFNDIVSDYRKMYNCDMDEAYKNIGNALKENKYHSVSDIVGGITNNKCHGKYGHYQKDYWEKSYRLEKEAFAHFYEAYIRNDGDKIKVLSEMFPTANKEFFNLLGG